MLLRSLLKLAGLGVWIRSDVTKGSDPGNERKTDIYKNNIDLIGFLGSDPEARSTSNGTAVTTFSLATKSSWKNDADSYESQPVDISFAD